MTLFKVKTGNVFIFVGFVFVLVADRTFWELSDGKGLKPVLIQCVCVPLKMWEQA